MIGPRRQLAPAEMEVIFRLAQASPDLVADEARLMAGLSKATPSGKLAWSGPALRPNTWRELTEAVRRGILSGPDARRYVDLPGREPPIWRTAWLRFQRGGRPEVGR